MLVEELQSCGPEERQLDVVTVARVELLPRPDCLPPDAPEATRNRSLFHCARRALSLQPCAVSDGLWNRVRTFSRPCSSSWRPQRQAT